MSFAPLNNWRCGNIQRWRLRALDDQPEHERQLCEECRLENSQFTIPVLRCQQSRKTENDPAAAGDEEPDAAQARQKARPVHEHSQWETPYTSKHQSRS